MSVYPSHTDVGWSRPESITFVRLVLKTTFEDVGKQTRKIKTPYPLRNVSLTYNHLTKAKFEKLRQFYIARSDGSTFSFFTSSADHYAGEYVRTGDGTTTQFDLPCKSASLGTLYLDGVAITNGVDFTFVPAAAGDGGDMATFTFAPATGDRLLIDFTGILRIRCVFAEESIQTDELFSWWKRAQVNLEGRLNDE